MATTCAVLPVNRGADATAVTPMPWKTLADERTGRGPPMSLIAVEAALVVRDATQRDAIVAASAPIQAATRRDEPGCLVYCFAADPVEPNLIQVYELWEDEQSLAAHFDHPNYTAMRDMLRESGLESTVSRKLRIDAVAPVYDADRRPIAGFGDV
jgi:quinol monooxygenase YgiN